MELRKLGASGLNVSLYCLGAGMFGNEETGCDQETAQAILDLYMDAGGNFLDVADFYGDGAVETVVGNIIRGRRDRLVLATKVGLWHGPGSNTRGLSRKHILDGVEHSLKRLRTDYVDLYQVHSVDPWTPIEETLRALDDCVRAGKVRYVGCSNFEAWRLMKALGVARAANLAGFISIQLMYSLISRSGEREHVPLCLAEGVGLLPYAALGGGILTGKLRRGVAPPAESRLAKSAYYRSRIDDRSVEVAEVLAAEAKSLGITSSQLALAWTALKRGVASVIVGARSVEQMRDNLGAVGVRVAPEARQHLDEISAPVLGQPYDMIQQLNSFVAPEELAVGTGNRQRPDAGPRYAR